MSLSGKRIAVVGGGIAGLSSALALAQRGARVEVFEQAAAFEEVGAGLQISPNGVKVLDALGLKTCADNRQNMPDRVELSDHRHGRRIATLPMNVEPSAPFLQLHRADLLEDLRVGCAASGVVLHLSRSVTHSKMKEATDLDLWIGADGVRSGIRTAFFEGQEPVFTGQAAWRALLPLNSSGISWPKGVTRLYLGPHRHVVVYPLRDGTLLNIVAVEERDEWVEEGWHQTGEPEQLQNAFSGWAGKLTALLAEVKDPILWGLFTHAPLVRWSNGNIVLVGDAAHPMLPFMAQGACAALEDAWVLARSLDQADDLQEGLRAYEAQRKPRATKIQNISDGNSKIYHAANPFFRVGLHAGMAVSSRLMPSLMTRRFDWIYDHDVTAD